MVIELFGEGGLKICDRVASIGFRVWEQRPVVTKWNVAWLLAKCLVRPLMPDWHVWRRTLPSQKVYAARGSSPSNSEQKTSDDATHKVAE